MKHRAIAAMLVFLAASCAPEPQPQDFTIIAIPDTQNYVAGLGGGSPELFEAQTRWIVENRDSLNIAFVSHLGDFVQNGDEVASEWAAADEAMSLLEDSRSTGLKDGIPYGIAVGNHDQSPEGDARGSTREFNHRFGTQRFEGRSYYGGHFGDSNGNHFEIFTVAGNSFLFFHLEYDLEPAPMVLAWVDSVLTANPTRKAFLSTHYLMNEGEGGSFSRQGRSIYGTLKDQKQLLMMFGGRVVSGGGEGRHSDSFADHTIHSVLSDFQGYPHGGDGWLRIMHIYPSRNLVSIKTFSPIANSGSGGYLSDENSEFELRIDFEEVD